MVFLLFGWPGRKENKGSHILPGPPFPFSPNWAEMERNVEWGNVAAFFDFLFLSKLQFCLFGLLLTSPTNEGIKVNKTFSSFHFSAFAIQTNIFFSPLFPSPRVCLVRGVEKWKGKKLFYLVWEKSERIENVVYMNWLLCHFYNKIPKGLYHRWGYLCNLLSTSSSLLSFPLKLGGQNFVGQEGKFFTPFSFPLIFSLEPNKGNFNFPPYFSLILFLLACFHQNQTGSKGGKIGHDAKT